jgi:signal transduction histidine kinase
MNLAGLFSDILVVDEATDFVRSIRSVLQSAGYIVRSVSNGAAALEAARSDPPDLILLSASLPDMTGYEVARQLKSDQSSSFIPVIMTAPAEGADVAAALNAGADEFIGKPVDNAELLIRIRAMLRMKDITDDLTELNATLDQKVEERTRQLEEAHAKLRHNEKLSALGRLSASVAHEVNNPLGAIMAHIYLLKQDLPDKTSSLWESLDVIEHEVDVIADLVDQLRSFSKPPRKERRPVNLNEVVENVMTLAGKELQKQHIDVTLDLQGPLSLVEASEDQLEEVFMNLVLNARDAMPEGGELMICTQEDDSCVQAQVIDTGQGIDPEIEDRIFEPFFTTKGEKGTGLGLAISHSIVDEHNGEIEVESEVGRGTTFNLRLPKIGDGAFKVK